jgi:acyl-CoA reductase-like NAD-dependent aldehyde dehydrogenase
VLDDVEVDQVADDIFRSAFANCGQICVAVKRVYAPARLRAELVDALADRARAARVGDGSKDGIQIGPLCNRQQFDRVRGLVADAVRHGATVAAGGGAIDGPGNFFEPTILTGLDDGYRIVAEEQFGPALPALSYLRSAA